MGRHNRREGQVGATSYTRYAAHAAVGCASSVASGGQCRQGAAAAAFGKWVTNYTPQDWSVAARGVAAAAAGCVVSVIGGGKFQNGAVTAAYGYLFNYLTVSARARSSVNAMRAKSADFADALNILDKSPMNFSIDIGSDVKTPDGGAVFQPNGGSPKILVNSWDITNSYQYETTSGRFVNFSVEQAIAHEVGHAVDYIRHGNGAYFLGENNAIRFENSVMRQMNPNSLLRSDSGRTRWIGR